MFSKSPIFQARVWALDHQKCMIRHLQITYNQANVKCSTLQPYMFNKRIECLHAEPVSTCRFNGDALALTLDRALDLESYPSATLKRMMYLSDADAEYVLPTYYYRQTALLRHQMGDALCLCRLTPLRECEPLHTLVYNSKFEGQHYIMSKKSEYTIGNKPRLGKFK